MPKTSVPADPRQIATRGEQIYEERYRESLEAEHPGKFVAIDILTGDANINDTPEGALGDARSRNKTGLFHLIKIGATGAFKVGYSSEASFGDWVFGQR